MTFPDSALFAAAVADHRFWIALSIAILAGLVRGFSGFGSAQIYIPLIAAVYSPRIAAVSLLIIDTLGAAPFAVRAFAYCTWAEVLPMYIAAAVAVPIGTWALLVIDPVVLRWFIAFLVLSLVGVLASGWRYHGRPRLPVTAAVGLFSGFGSGAVQIAGPPVLIYWLGTTNKVITVRANFLVYFLLLGLTSCAVYFWQGLFTPESLALALLLAIPFFVATAAGAKYFHGSSDQLYRRIAYAIIAASALVSLPVFDTWLH
ncbi:MAG TPA: sulfite exporter TauE/SafE family protein [Xanthobacteraceae bacterium]|nr:sulfite exporter TauE/SafE family protein [Xanthobacteraceae bacterium]